MMKAHGICAQLLVSCCLVALAQPAFAADAKETPQESSREPGADPAPQPASDTLEEIVVTAERREESLQRVPVSVSALTSSQLGLAGVGGSVNLGEVVPGLVFTKNIGSSAPYLRGVGPGPTGQPGYESPVAVYVDGVYKPNAAQSATTLQNVERLEVLRGPQGTLFGRNSAAGVINIITKDPSFEPSGDFTYGYGSYRTLQGEFYGTTGLSDTVAANLSLYGLNQADGWGYNPVNGKDIFTQSDYAARAKLLWAPTDATKVVLAAAINRTRGYQGPTQGTYPGALGADGKTVYISRYVIPQDVDAFGILRSRDVSLRVEHDFGAFQVRNIVGYGHFDSTVHNDADGTGSIINEAEPFLTTQSTYTEEFHVFSPDSSKLKWIAGVYLLKDDIKIDETLRTTTRTDQLIMPLHTKSWSVFGQTTVPIVTNTNLTLGVRYSHDTKDYLYSNYDPTKPGTPLKPVAANGCGPLTFIAGTCFGEKSWGDFSFRAALDHQLTRDVLLFASFNRGFQSGAFNVTVANAPPIDPVTVNAYEAGVKSEFFGRRARLNVSVFYYDYKNLQVRANINNQVFVFNAASSKVKGVDVDFEARLMRGLTLRASGEILDAKYESFPGFVKLVPRPTGGNVSSGTVDVSGQPLVRSPKFTGNIGPVFTFPVGFGDITLNANFAHNSGFDWEPGGLLKQRAYDVINAGIRWKSNDRNWEIAFSGTNITDEVYFLKGGRASTNDSYVPAAPRMFMGTITRHF